MQLPSIVNSQSLLASVHEDISKLRGKAQTRDVKIQELETKLTVVEKKAESLIDEVKELKPSMTRS